MFIWTADFNVKCLPNKLYIITYAVTLVTYIIHILFILQRMQDRAYLKRCLPKAPQYAVLYLRQVKQNKKLVYRITQNHAKLN